MPNISAAREQKRQDIVRAAKALIGESVTQDFDAVHDPLCAFDVVIVAGAPWFEQGMHKDYLKDESGYKKLGGSSNSPEMNYFFRRSANLIYYLKRQGLYIPKGGQPLPCAGMMCFFDWEDRGRFNFTPDFCGVILGVENGCISKVVMAQSMGSGFAVHAIDIKPKDPAELALVGYGDYP